MKKSREYRVFITTLYATTLLAVFFACASYWTAQARDGRRAERILADVHVGTTSLKGKNPLQASEALITAERAFLQRDMLFRYGDRYWSLNPDDIDLQFNNVAITAQAQTERSIRGLLSGVQIPASYTYDDAKLADFFDQIKIDAKNARGEQLTVARNVARAELHAGLSRLVATPIELTLSPVAGDIRERDQDIDRRLVDELTHTAITVRVGDASQEITPETQRSWMEFVPVSLGEIDSDANALVPARGTALRAALDTHITDITRSSAHASTESFVNSSLTRAVINSDEQIILPRISDTKLAATLTPLNTRIAREPRDARFSFIDGKLEVTQPSTDGLGIDLPKARTAIAHALLTTTSGAPSIELATTAIPARIHESDPEIAASIRELVGKGTSNMGHSSGARVRNVTVGTSRFDGLVIPPGEEVSAGKTIGEVDQAHGFVPELVILDHKTVPQDGGGLCQVATTLFRSVTDGGLAVTARRNHSYAVSYYAPQGTDATIYYPATDFKFKNDTSHYMLIHSWVSGMNVFFEIYGTRDGRAVEISTPYSYDRRPDGSMKAVWKRRVTLDGQLIHDDVFLSVYRSPKDFPHQSN